MNSRQQKRAKAREPQRVRRRGTYRFLAILTVLTMAGIAGVAFIKFNPPPITRGANAGEHWHAKYELQICGQKYKPFSANEAEIHTHGDGLIHNHPSTDAYTGRNANLGAFLQSVEVMIGEEASATPGPSSPKPSSKAKKYLQMPDGQRYVDGESKCEGIEGPQKLVVTDKGVPVKGDPHFAVIHDNSNFVVRFGPKPPAKSTPGPNPFNKPVPGSSVVTGDPVVVPER